MTEHKSIQNPQDYTPEDYQTYERQLFDPATSKETLENICMTLAHLPTGAAQALLAKFRESVRAPEVSWLECAVEEGQFHYLSPTNDEEERDLLALKVIQEMEDDIIDLEIEYDKVDLKWRKNQIKLEAIKALMAEGELDDEAGVGYDVEMPRQQEEMEDLRERIEEMEKIIARIKQSIQTERFKNVDSTTMRHFHFDGEE